MPSDHHRWPIPQKPRQKPKKFHRDWRPCFAGKSGENDEGDEGDEKMKRPREEVVEVGDDHHQLHQLLQNPKALEAWAEKEIDGGGDGEVVVGN